VDNPALQTTDMDNMTDATKNGFEQSHPDWQSTLEDFERKLDALTIALQEARQAGQRLARLHAASALSPVQTAAPMLAAVEQLASPPDVPAPPAPPPVVEEDLTRDEVRRAVEQTRYDMENNGRMAAVGWAMPRDFWPGVTPAAPAHETEAEAEDEDPERSKVRRMVEAAKAELAKGHLEPLEDSDGKGLDDLSPKVVPSALIPAPAPSAMPSWTNMSITAETPGDNAAAEIEPPADPPLSEEAMREDVRLAVQRARAEMETGAPPSSKDPSPSEAVPEEEDGRRNDVRRAVAQARAEMSWSLNVEEAPEPESGAAAPDDEDAKRGDVRRAVEQARAEMSSDGLRMFDDSAPPESDGLKSSALFAAFSGGDDTPAWQKAKDAEMASMPASIVIEDEVGRVELARVYDTLNRVERPSASLLNYSPHSVTVGLAVLEALPDSDVMITAIQAAFGRPCRVVLDGSRMSVKIGDSEKAA
jgi:hypothetical protein